MSLSWYYGVPLVMTAAFLGDIFCRDASYLKQSDVESNSWPKLPAWELPQKNTTTPWPTLSGNNRDHSNVGFAHNPTWVRPTTRPNNMPSWQRQGPIPNHSFNIGSYQGPRQDTRSPSFPSYIEVTDDELRELSQVLLNKDVNNAASYVTINLQKETTSRSQRDQAPLPLLSINKDAFKIPSIAKILHLYDNYIVQSNVKEDNTPQEKQEEETFLDVVVDTPVMQHTRNFLVQKGKIGHDLREFKNILREIWFNMYTRGQRKVGSSGFEHVFLTEIKNGQISGLHNWIYFDEQEKQNRANYLGYMKKIDLGNKGAILKFHFTFQEVDKPVGSMFIGTSPEFEMALYTTCFLLRADKICPLKLNGHRFIIRTFTYRYQGKQLIGSAFPEI